MPPLKTVQNLKATKSMKKIIEKCIKITVKYEVYWPSDKAPWENICHHDYIYIHDIFEKKDRVVSFMKRLHGIDWSSLYCPTYSEVKTFQVCRKPWKRKHKLRENKKHRCLQSMAELGQISRVQGRLGPYYSYIVKKNRVCTCHTLRTGSWHR